MRMKNKERKPNNSKCSFEYTSDFCKRLKSVREERKISFAKIDAELHIPESTMKKYEYERVPNIETIIKLANFYGVDTDYLIGIQPYPSRDVRLLQDATGLSEKACKHLIFLSRDRYTRDTFEFLITHNDFKYLLDHSRLYAGTVERPGTLGYASFKMYNDIIMDYTIKVQAERKQRILDYDALRKQAEKENASEEYKENLWDEWFGDEENDPILSPEFAKYIESVEKRE